MTPSSRERPSCTGGTSAPVGYASRYRRRRRATSRSSTAVASVIRSPRISDTHKERVLPVYALRLAGLSLALLGMLIAIASPFLLVGLVAFHGLDAFAAAMIDPWLLVLMVALATAWFALRRGTRHGV